MGRGLVQRVPLSGNVAGRFCQEINFIEAAIRGRDAEGCMPTTHLLQVGAISVLARWMAATPNLTIAP